MMHPYLFDGVPAGSARRRAASETDWCHQVQSPDLTPASPRLNLNPELNSATNVELAIAKAGEFVYAGRVAGTGAPQVWVPFPDDQLTFIGNIPYR